MKTTLLAALLLVGCSDVVEHGISVRLLVATWGCDGAAVGPGATHLRLRSLHGGVLFDERVWPAGDPAPQVAWVADSGTSVVRVEAFAGEPATGELLAWGQSAPLVVPSAAELQPTQPTALVRLAAVNRFERQCPSLGRARAGHTATAMDDGRVAIIGGFTGLSPPEALASIEVLDVAAGRVTRGGTLALSNGTLLMPTAHHAAARGVSPQVVVWGGQQWSQPGVASVSSVVLVWDPESSAVGALRPPPPGEAVLRAGHAVVPLGEDLYALGGVTRTSAGLAPAAAVQRLNMRFNEVTRVGDLPEPRADAAIAPLGEAAAVVAGGQAAGGVSARVDVVTLQPTLAAPWIGALSQARRLSAAAPLGDGVLVAGGEDAAGQPSGVTDWVRNAVTPHVEAGPTLEPRSSPCAAALGDGRVLVLGGMGPAGVSVAAEVVDLSGAAEAVTFPGPARWQHTCTPLTDGSVLVAGGVGADGEVLGDSWRYVPAPPPVAGP